MEESIRVLHVDDEPDFADMASTFLEQADDRIDVATEHDPSDALDRLQEDAFDCVVSDYDMPSRNGIELLEAVRDEYEDLPFILFTGKGSEDVASDAISAGVTDYLQKETGPEQFELLANRIANTVSQHRAERRASEQERILALLRDVNQALVMGTTRDEIERSVTTIFADAEGYRLAWMAEHDADRNRVVPRTVAGVDADAVTPTALPDDRPDEDVLDGTEPPDEGIVAEALRTGDIAVTRQRDPTLAVGPDGGSPVEYAAAAVVPIVYHGDSYGVLALYADQPDQFDDAERAMLDEIGGDLAQALHGAETRRTLRRHQTAVEAVPEGVFILDEDARIVLANESTAALVDRTPEEVEGELFPTLVEEGVFDEDIVDWYLDGVREMLSSSTDREDAWYETEIQPPGGDSRIVEIHLTLRPFDEEFRGTVGVIRDVTERKRREQELMENKERYRRLVENAPVPIAMYDDDGDLAYVNDAAVELVGADDRESLLGDSALAFVHPDDHEKARTRMQRVLEDREPVSPAELTLVDRAGNQKETIITGVPVTYESEPAGQIVIKDITEQKQRERRLQRQRDHLDEFASIVSHDLQNPLGVLKGSLELAEQTGEADHFDRCYRAVDRMDQLLEDLLTMARQGQTVDEIEPVDVGRVTEECWRTVETADAALETDIERTIRADEGRLRQLLENLVRNAVDHGGDDVTITVGELDDDGFYVEDDGSGFETDEPETVFDSGYTTADERTGLGLAIVKRITDAHDWEITATEGDEGGARFEITNVTFEGE